LESLGFQNKIIEKNIMAKIPSYRNGDMKAQEDLIEEIARVYGYHNLPSILPSIQTPKTMPYANNFYFEQRAKETLKYWGFTEIYTYSMVSSDLYEGPEENAVTIQNPLSEDFVYLRCTLVPSLLKVVSENKEKNNIKIFELANVYIKNGKNLPKEILMLAGVVKKQNNSFYEMKGIIEQLLLDLGIKKINFKESEKGGMGASLYLDKDYLGEIEVLGDEIINFEINFEKVLKKTTLKKEYKPLPKYPPIVEDLSIVISESVSTKDIIETIKNVDSLISDVSLFDQFENSRTFHIIYQDKNKNLTGEEVKKIREKILKNLQEKFHARIKE